LYRILLYRELGLPLDAIAAVVDGGDGDPATQLREQHALLVGRIDRLRRMAASVEHVLEAMEMGRSLTPEEKSEIFGEFGEPPGYAEQAGRRWGATAEWQVAQDRVAAMDTADWRRAEAERADWVRRLLALVDSGAAADSPGARELAEEHRRSLAGFMGECDHEMQCRIAELYVSEPEQLGFLVREQDQRPGLAEFVVDMIRANSPRDPF
jgi:DNA-binding transcriptional MerR regulator